MDTFAYSLLPRANSTENLYPLALPEKYTMGSVPSPRFSSCSAWHAARSFRETMVESRLSEHPKHHEEDAMSHRRKKFLSAGLAGELRSTALFVLTAAHAGLESVADLFICTEA